MKEVYSIVSEKGSLGREEKSDEDKHELVQINDDYMGWISINNTKIDYPVVKGKDNSYYLTHNFYKEQDFAGAIFMDYRNSAEKLDQHLIVYGHHMKDKSMFGDLPKYTDQAFFEKNKLIHFDFQGRTYEWEIFSVYVVDSTDLLPTEFQSANEFEEFGSQLQQKSVISTSTMVEEGDHILTLFTCTNVNELERMIVHAKLIN